MPQGRTAFYHFLCKLVATVAVKVIPPFAPGYVAATLVLFSAFTSFFLHLRFLPHYRFAMAQLACACGALWLWAAVCALVSAAFAQPHDSGTAVVFYLLSPVAVWAGVIAAATRRRRLERCEVHTLTHPHEVELKSRLFLEPITLDATHPHALDLAVLQPEHAPYYARVEEWFAYACQRWPMTGSVRVHAALFALHYKRDTTTAERLVRAVEWETNPSFDVQFVIFRLCQHVRHVQEEMEYAATHLRHAGARSHALFALTSAGLPGKSAPGAAGSTGTAGTAGAVTDASSTAAAAAAAAAGGRSPSSAQQQKQQRDMLTSIALERVIAEAVRTEERAAKTQVNFWLELQKPAPTLSVLAGMALDIAARTEQAVGLAVKIARLRRTLRKSAAVDEQLRRGVDEDDNGAGLLAGDGAGIKLLEDNIDLDANEGLNEDPLLSGRRAAGAGGAVRSSSAVVGDAADGIWAGLEDNARDVDGAFAAARRGRHRTGPGGGGGSEAEGAIPPAGSFVLALATSTATASGSAVTAGAGAVQQTAAARTLALAGVKNLTRKQGGAGGGRGGDRGGDTPARGGSGGGAGGLGGGADDGGAGGEAQSGPFRVEEVDDAALATLGLTLATGFKRISTEGHHGDGGGGDGDGDDDEAAVETGDGYNSAQMASAVSAMQRHRGQLATLYTDVSGLDRRRYRFALPSAALLTEPFATEHSEFLRRYALLAVSSMLSAGFSGGSRGKGGNGAPRAAAHGEIVPYDYSAPLGPPGSAAGVYPNSSAAAADRILQANASLFVLCRRADSLVFPALWAVRPCRHPSSPLALFLRLQPLPLARWQAYITVAPTGTVTGVTDTALMIFAPPLARAMLPPGAASDYDLAPHYGHGHGAGVAATGAAGHNGATGGAGAGAGRATSAAAAAAAAASASAAAAVSAGSASVDAAQRAAVLQARLARTHISRWLPAWEDLLRLEARSEGIEVVVPLASVHRRHRARHSRSYRRGSDRDSDGESDGADSLEDDTGSGVDTKSSSGSDSDDYSDTESDASSESDSRSDSGSDSRSGSSRSGSSGSGSDPDSSADEEEAEDGDADAVHSLRSRRGKQGSKRNLNGDGDNGDADDDGDDDNAGSPGAFGALRHSPRPTKGGKGGKGGKGSKGGKRRARVDRGASARARARAQARATRRVTRHRAAAALLRVWVAPDTSRCPLPIPGITSAALASTWGLTGDTAPGAAGMGSSGATMAARARAATTMAWQPSELVTPQDPDSLQKLLDRSERASAARAQPAAATGPGSVTIAQPQQQQQLHGSRSNVLSPGGSAVFGRGYLDASTPMPGATPTASQMATPTHSARAARSMLGGANGSGNGNGSAGRAADKLADAAPLPLLAPAGSPFHGGNCGYTVFVQLVRMLSHRDIAPSASSASTASDSGSTAGAKGGRKAADLRVDVAAKAKAKAGSRLLAPDTDGPNAAGTPHSRAPGEAEDGDGDAPVRTPRVLKRGDSATTPNNNNSKRGKTKAAVTTAAAGLAASVRANPPTRAGQYALGIVAPGAGGDGSGADGAAVAGLLRGGGTTEDDTDADARTVTGSTVSSGSGRTGSRASRRRGSNGSRANSTYSSNSRSTFASSYFDDIDEASDDAWVFDTNGEFLMSSTGRYDRLQRWKAFQELKLRGQKQRVLEARMRLVDRLRKQNARTGGKTDDLQITADDGRAAKLREKAAFDVEAELRLLINDENRNTQSATRRFQIVFVGTIIFLTLMAMAQYVAVLVQVLAYKTNLALVETSTLRSEATVRLAYNAYVASLLRAGLVLPATYQALATPTQSQLQLSIYSLSRILSAAHAAVTDRVSSFGSAFQALMTSAAVAVQVSMGAAVTTSTLSQASVNMATRAAEVSALAPAMVDPRTQASTFYIIFNGVGEVLTKMVASSTALASNVLNNVTAVNNWALWLMVVSFILMVLIIVFVLRPSVRLIQSTQAKVMDIFLNIPMAPIRLLHAQTVVRLSALSSELELVREAIKDAETVAREEGENMPKISQSEAGTAISSYDGAFGAAAMGGGASDDGATSSKQGAHASMYSLIIKLSFVFIFAVAFSFIQYFALYEPVSSVLLRSATTLAAMSEQSVLTARALLSVTALSTTDASVLVPGVATLAGTRALLSELQSLSTALLDGRRNPPVASLVGMVSSRTISAGLESLWFANACAPVWSTDPGEANVPATAVDEYGATIVVGPFTFTDYFVYSRTGCMNFEDRAIGSGLRIAVLEFTSQLSIIVDKIEAGTATTASPLVYDDFVRFDTYWRLMQATQTEAVSKYHEQVIDEINYFIVASSILFGVFCFIILVAYICVYHPLILKTHAELKAARTMLFLIPADVLSSVPIFQQWLRVRKQQAQQQTV